MGRAVYAVYGQQVEYDAAAFFLQVSFPCLRIIRLKCQKSIQVFFRKAHYRFMNLLVIQIMPCVSFLPPLLKCLGMIIHSLCCVPIIRQQVSFRSIVHLQMLSPFQLSFMPQEKNLKGKDDKLVQQMDIMPTVLNYLGYDKPYFSFGFDAFSPRKDNFVVNNIGDAFNFYQGDYYMVHDGVKPLSLYNLREDRLQKKDLLKSDKAIADSLDGKLKAFIQQYNYRMIHNKLVAE